MLEIKSLSENVFLFYFKNREDLALSFLRYQEYYESPNDNFRNKNFLLEDYKKWYVEDRGEFSYADDWAGFNIPSRVVQELIDAGISDKNEYDYLMLGAFDLCKRNCKSDKFYIIGVSKLDSNALEHEKAHGLYYTNEEYKIQCNSITNYMSDELFNDLRDGIIKLGYTEEVIHDEIQAYLSSGGVVHIETMTSSEKKSLPFYNEYKSLKKDYKKLYNKFKKVFNV